LWCALVLREVLQFGPDAVISAGAAPGFFCIVAGRLIGAKTLRIDIVANGEERSICGKLSKHFEHQCPTQCEWCGSPG
jgi:hypothetical protein